MPDEIGTQLHRALARIGADAEAKRELIAALKGWEARNSVAGEAVRDTTSGWIVDALFAEVDRIEHKVEIPGQRTPLNFAMRYRSKVGREVAMADSPVNHVWEPQTTKLLLQLADSAQHVLIGGAYAGDHAIPMMQVMASRGGQCHCFEPNREQSAMLEENARSNGLTNFRLSNDGLWSATQKLVMVGTDSHAHPEVYNGQKGFVFQAMSIDDYVSSAGIIGLDVIMLDIEGGEHQALRGAHHQITAPADTAPDIVFEIHRSYVDWSGGLAATPICSLLIESGYTLYAIRDYQGNVAMPVAPVEVVPIETCYLEGPPHGFNIFASKRSGTPERLDLRIVDHVSPKLLKHRDPALHQPLLHPE